MSTVEGSAPVPYPQLALSGPAAGFVADLYSVSQDLVFARDCAMAYAAKIEQEQGSAADSLAVRALWNAGAISYRRAFSTGSGHLVAQGKRLRLDAQFVALLDEEQKAAHTLVLEMANKHIAHRVGDHEGAVIVALLEPPPSPRSVAGVGTMSVRMIGPERSVAEHLAVICDVFLGEVTAEFNRRTNGMLIELQASPDLDAMYAAATTPTPPP